MSERILERRKTTRKQVDPRDTFDWTTPNLEVVARPIDPFITPPSPETVQLASALGVVLQAAKSYDSYKQQKNKVDYDEGQDVRRRGEQLPIDGRSAAFIRGFEELDGRYKAIDYKQKAAEFFEEHKNDDPDTFKAEWSKFTTDYMNNELGTDNTIRGFSPAALEVEDSYMSAYSNYQIQITKEQTYSKINGVFRDDITTEVGKLIGIGSLEELNDPDKYLKYYQGKDIFKNATGEKFREYLSAKMEEYQTVFNLSKSEVSALFYSNIKEIADRYDMPELLDYAFKKDKDGIAVVDNPGLKEDIYNTLASAESGQARRLEGFNKALTAQRDNYIKTRQNELSYQIMLLQPTDVQKAADILKEITSDEVLMSDPGTKAFANDLEKILEGNGHPQASNSDAYTYLSLKLSGESLSAKELVENRFNLSWTDYKSLLNDLNTQEERKRNRATKLGDVGAKEYSKWKTAIMNNIISGAKSVDTLQLGSATGKAITPTITNELFLVIWGLESKYDGIIPPDVMQREVIDYFNNKIAINKPASTKPQPQYGYSMGPAPGTAKVWKSDSKPAPKQQQQPTKKETPKQESKVPKGYKDTGNIDPKTGKKVYQRPDGAYVTLGD